MEHCVWQQVLACCLQFSRKRTRNRRLRDDDYVFEEYPQVRPLHQSHASMLPVERVVLNVLIALQSLGAKSWSTRANNNGAPSAAEAYEMSENMRGRSAVNTAYQHEQQPSLSSLGRQPAPHNPPMVRVHSPAGNPSGR